MKVVCSKAAYFLKDDGPAVYHDIVQFDQDYSLDEVKEAKEHCGFDVEAANQEIDEMERHLKDTGCKKVITVSVYFHVVDAPQYNFGVLLRRDDVLQYEDSCLFR